MKNTALFDSNIDNGSGVQYKEDGLIEVITDYNDRYNQDFNLAKHDKSKKDIASRLHIKNLYTRIERTTEE